MKTLKILLAFFLVMPPVFADTYTKSQVLLVGEAQSWIAGDKKRTEFEAPIIGKVVIVTRVDQGVEFISIPGKKIYQEKPIALPYFASEDSGGGGTGGSGSSSTELFPKDSEGEKSDCVPELHPLSGTKKFAGFESSGYEATCGKGPGVGKLWVAPPVGALKEVTEQSRAYNHQHAVALFAKYPPNEKAELIEVTEKFGDAVKELLASRLGNKMAFPPGVIMAMDGKFDTAGKGPSTTIYEVKEIKAAPADPALFEIPQDYEKVPNVAKAVLASGFKDLNKMIRRLKKIMDVLPKPENGA